MKPRQIVKHGTGTRTLIEMQAGPPAADFRLANDNPPPDRVLLGGLVFIAVCLVAVVGLMVALVAGL